MKIREQARELRQFLILWAGQSASQLGSEMTAFALTIWAYQQEGTVMSVALLMICTLVPKALASIPAGPLVDRWGKKAVMLISDSLSALVSLTVLLLAVSGRLRVSHLYAVKIVLGVCAAFQNPASSVVISLLVPRQHYLRVSGLQSFSDSLVTICQPILATAVYAFGGLKWVLIVDLTSFLAAFITLCPMRIPASRGETASDSFFTRLRQGAAFLRTNRGVAHLMAYQGLLNLMAGIAYYSVLTPMILERTGNNELILGAVNSCVGAGMMLGALLVTIRPPRGNRVTVMGVAYMLCFFLCDFFFGVGRSPWVWCVMGLVGNISLPYGDACLTTLYRENIPVDMQGRVFSARNALVHAMTVAGYLAGAFAADYGAAALFSLQNPAADFLRQLLGEGPGRAMGVAFLFTSTAGLLASLSVLRSRRVRELERNLSQKQ